MADFKETHWALLDLQYEYLNDGFKLIATTDVPCHLFCRMTTTPPRKHVLPSSRRGTRFTGDIRFCFVVYEDNEQEEAGDTLIHTFIKDNWPICETRWFYFVGSQGGVSSVSETAIFKFHFPAPPPEPPPPIHHVFYAQDNNRTLEKSALTWPPAHNAWHGIILGNFVAPNYALFAGSYLRGGWHYIWRAPLIFDTSSIPATRKIVSASISPYVFTMSGTHTKKIYVTYGAQHDPIITSDYGRQLPYTVVWGERNDLVPGSYQEIPLNAKGLIGVRGQAISTFCLRGQVDLNDENPVAVYNNYIWFYSAQKGAGYRPMLTVDYYPA